MMMESNAQHEQHLYSDRSMYSDNNRTKKSIIAPFLKNLFIILQNEDPSIIGWVDDGMAFEVRDMEKMSSVILPKYFRHSKFASFQRQLNYFGFKKLTKSHTQVCTYSRMYFCRDNVNGLLLIKRKTHNILGKSRSNSVCSVSSYSSKSSFEMLEEANAELPSKQELHLTNTDPIPVRSINHMPSNALAQYRGCTTQNGLLASRNDRNNSNSLQLLVEAQKVIGSFDEMDMEADLDAIFSNTEDLVKELGGENMKLGDTIDVKAFLPLIPEPSPCVQYTPALQLDVNGDWDISLMQNNFDLSWAVSA